MMLELALTYPEYRDNAARVELIETTADAYYGKGYQDVQNRVPKIDNTCADLDWQPSVNMQDALKRILTPRLYPGPRDVFATLLREPAKISIGSRVSQLKADHGHIVVRVAPGGDTYQVFVLDDTTEDAKVIGVFGPYDAK